MIAVPVISLMYPARNSMASSSVLLLFVVIWTPFKQTNFVILFSLAFCFGKFWILQALR